MTLQGAEELRAACDEQADSPRIGWRTVADSGDGLPQPPSRVIRREADDRDNSFTGTASICDLSGDDPAVPLSAPAGTDSRSADYPAADTKHASGERPEGPTAQAVASSTKSRGVSPQSSDASGGEEARTPYRLSSEEASGANEPRDGGSNNRPWTAGSQSGPLAPGSERDRQSVTAPSPSRVEAARSDDIEYYPPGAPGTVRCRYCGANHECDEDGQIQWACEAEHAFRAAHGGRSWWGVRLRGLS